MLKRVITKKGHHRLNVISYDNLSLWQASIYGRVYHRAQILLEPSKSVPSRCVYCCLMYCDVGGSQDETITIL